MSEQDQFKYMMWALSFGFLILSLLFFDRDRNTRLETAVTKFEKAKSAYENAKRQIEYRAIIPARGPNANQDGTVTIEWTDDMPNGGTHE